MSSKNFVPHQYSLDFESTQIENNKTTETLSENTENSEKVIQNTKEKVTKIQPKYEKIAKIGKNNYEYAINFSKESPNTIIIRLRNKNSRNKPHIFIVTLEEIPEPTKEIDRTNGEEYFYIHNNSIKISSIKKEGRGNHTYLNGAGENITSFNYFKNFIFASPQGVHKDFLEIIKNFLLSEYHKNQPEKE